jgi:transposase-like protein
MNDEIRRLRVEARRLAHGKFPSQVRYPDTFRRAAVALVRQRVGQGASVAQLARRLGVSEPTLTKWLRPALRPVAVTVPPGLEPPAGAAPVLITPTGVQVTGLDRATLVAVLQALG